MADNRYKNGQFTNKRGAATQAAAIRVNQSLKTHPCNWGWSFLFFDDLDRAVFEQGPYTMRFIPGRGRAVVEHGAKEGSLYPLDWSLEQINQDLFEKEVK